MEKDTAKKGFTLIELLVVISIIAILMAIMVPALSKARELAKNAICKSNLKNIGLAALLWSEDNDGWALPGLWDRGYEEGGNEVDSLLKPYLGDADSGEGVGLCPTVPAKYAGKTYGDLGFSSSDLANVAASTKNFYSSYGYNQTLINKTDKPLGTYNISNDNGKQWGKDAVWYKKHGNTKIATIANPGQKIMFAESYLYLSSPWIYDVDNVNSPNFSEPADLGRRHFPKKRNVPGTNSTEVVGQMNVAWINGTVSEQPEDFEQVKESGRGFELNGKYWYGD